MSNEKPVVAESSERPVPAWRRWLARLTPLLGLLLLVLAVRAAWQQLAGIALSDVRVALSGIGPLQWASCLGLTALSYAALAGYEWLAARWVGHGLSTRRVLATGAIAWAVSNTLGPAWLSGSAVRLRLYGGWGVAPGQVARIVAFGLLTFWSSFVVLAAGALALDPPDGLPWGRALGLGLLLAVAALIGVSAYCKGRLAWRGWSLSLPPPRVLLGQLAVGLADNLAAIGALYVLLPESSPLSYGEAVSLFAMSNLGGILSGMPGGMGTFDGTLIALASPSVGPAAVVAAVLAWRVLYGLVPLALALVGFAAIEVRRSALAGTVVSALGRAHLAAAPALLAISAALAGATLLLSAFTRSVERWRWLSSFEPVALLDASNAASAAIGVGLLFAARGLWQRSREALETTVGLVALGATASLVRGSAELDALALGGVLAVALSSRSAFHRRAALTEPPSLPRGLLLAGCVAVVVVAIGPFLLGSGPLLHDRALQGVGVVLAMLAAAALGDGLRPRPAPMTPPTEQDLADAVRIASEAGVSNGWLAATGDKALIFDDQRTAFLMYAVAGDTWVSYAGPIGAPERASELLWTFRERAQQAGARIALYEIPCEIIPLCADLGLRAYKFGEEARVALEGFTLAGRDNKSRRHAVTRAEREGSSFEIVPAEDVPALLPELARVSEAWLREKGGREKGFSLGRFDEAWLVRSPVAVVRRQGRVVAFANVLQAGPELSVDLMRFHPEAPKGTMDYLFLSLMLWGANHGFLRFNLGMAPLAGLPGGPVAPAWAKVARLVYRRGDAFYNFQGLRAYKEKFHPRWESRYLAVESGLALPGTLAALLRLVSGGFRGAVPTLEQVWTRARQ